MAEAWRQAAQWLNQVGVLPSDHSSISPHGSLYDFALVLQDGRILCHCLNVIVPGCVPNVNEKPEKQFQKIQNISAFLEALQSTFKIKDKDLFAPDELYYASEFGKVVHTLSVLSKTQRAGIAGFRYFPRDDVVSKPKDADSEDTYASLEALVVQGLTLEAAVHDDDVTQLYASSPFGTDEDDEEDIYGNLTSPDDAEIYSAVVGSHMPSVPADDEIYSSSSPDEKYKLVRSELVETERSYVKVLEMIIKDFKASFASSKAIAQSDVDLIFGNIEELLSTHVGLLTDLDAEFNKPDSVPKCFSEVFIRHKESLKCYGEFCCYIPEAAARIGELSSKKDTAKVLEEARSRSGQRFGLKDLLNVPMQRILKYPLLLKELAKHSPPNHPDKENLQVALATVQELARFINESKKNYENIKNIGDALRHFPRNLKEFGSLKKDGDLYYRQKKSKEKVKPRYIFLFQNGVLVTKQHKTAYNFKSVVDFAAHQELDEDFVVDKDDQPTPNHVHGFAIRDGSDFHIFITKSIPAKRHWIKAIRECLQAAKDTASGPPQIAPRTGTMSKSGPSVHRTPNAPLPPLPTTPTGPQKRSYEEWAPASGGSPAPSTPAVVSKDTADHLWFAGKMPRSKAEHVLNGTPDGTFLVRESDNRVGEYSLSIMFRDVKHIKINRRPNNTYDIAPDSVICDDLFSLVAHFESHSLNKHFPNMNTTLKIPFKKALVSKTMTMSGGALGTARTRYPYKAQSADELSFNRGEIIAVTSMQEEDEGWWRGVLMKTGENGLFPANFVKMQ